MKYIHNFLVDKYVHLKTQNQRQTFILQSGQGKQAIQCSYAVQMWRGVRECRRKHRRQLRHPMYM